MILFIEGCIAPTAMGTESVLISFIPELIIGINVGPGGSVITTTCCVSYLNAYLPSKVCDLWNRIANVGIPYSYKKEIDVILIGLR